MVEILTCSPPQTIKYQGLLRCKELYKEITDWLAAHSYDKNEIMNEEQVLEDGKQIFIHLEPSKNISDYAKIEMEINISISQLEKVTVEHEGIKKHMDKGNVSITIETSLITDYENKWQNKPFYYFSKKIMERFFFREYIDLYKAEVNEDKRILMRELKSFLNLYRFN